MRSAQPDDRTAQPEEAVIIEMCVETADRERFRLGNDHPRLLCADIVELIVEQELRGFRAQQAFEEQPPDKQCLVVAMRWTQAADLQAAIILLREGDRFGRGKIEDHGTHRLDCGEV